MFFLCRLLRDNSDYFSNLALNLNIVSLRQWNHSSDLFFLKSIKTFSTTRVFTMLTHWCPLLQYPTILYFHLLISDIYFCKLLCSAARAESLSIWSQQRRMDLHDRGELLKQELGYTIWLPYNAILCVYWRPSESPSLMNSTHKDSQAVLRHL